jgi:hypothetical protein
MSHSAVEDLIALEQTLCDLELQSPDLCADMDEDLPMELSLGSLALHDRLWIEEEEEEEEQEGEEEGDKAEGEIEFNTRL